MASAWSFTACDATTAYALQRFGVLAPHCSLHAAVRDNRVNVVSLLLAAGAYMEHRDAKHGQTPLSWACRSCIPPIVRVLVEAGADVESRSSAGLTPLHWACRFIDAESVEILLNAGADPGAVDQTAAVAAATSSSRSGTCGSMPEAIDVIGLGYPRKKALRCAFTEGSETLAARRLDLVSVRRIESALKCAKRERSWRRRGWLLILASRCVVMNLYGVLDKRWTGCGDGSTPLLPDRASASTSYDTSDCRHVQGEQIDKQNHARKRLSNINYAMGVVRAASCGQGHTRCEIEAQEGMGAVLVAELVASVLELASIEVGLFCRVIMYI